MRALVDPLALPEEVEAEARNGLRLVSFGEHTFSALLPAPMESNLLPMDRWTCSSVDGFEARHGLWKVNPNNLLFLTPFRFALFGFFISIYPPGKPEARCFTTVPRDVHQWIVAGTTVQVGHLSVSLPLHLVTD